MDQNKAEVGAYSTVSYSKQPQTSTEAGVEGIEDPLSQLYAQVDEDVKKKKSEDVFAIDQQEEASASALYAQVDEKRKKKKKKKKEEDSPPPELDQLYAQVDKKKKSKKKKEDTPPHESDQLYAQVDKKKRKKREKEEIEEVSAQESGDMFSPVPLKSDLLMEELQ